MQKLDNAPTSPAPGQAGAHLYEIHAADGRVLHQWADSPFEACALLGLLYTTALGVALGVALIC